MTTTRPMPSRLAFSAARSPSSVYQVLHPMIPIPTARPRHCSHCRWQLLSRTIQALPTASPGIPRRTSTCADDFHPFKPSSIWFSSLLNLSTLRSPNQPLVRLQYFSYLWTKMMSTPVQHTAASTSLWFRFISTVPVSLILFLRLIYATTNIQFQISPTIQKTRTHISDLTCCHLPSTNFTECLISRSVLALTFKWSNWVFWFLAFPGSHLQVSFALYFPIPTNQAQAYRAVRDMYSYDRAMVINSAFCQPRFIL